MSNEPMRPELEAKLLSLIKATEAAHLSAFSKLDARFERHWTRMNEIADDLRMLSETLAELESRVDGLEETKLDVLDERVVLSRLEHVELFDQVQRDAESKISDIDDGADVFELNARFRLLVNRISELERITRTQIR